MSETLSVCRQTWKTGHFKHETGPELFDTNIFSNLFICCNCGWDYRNASQFIPHLCTDQNIENLRYIHSLIRRQTISHLRQYRSNNANTSVTINVRFGAIIICLIIETSFAKVLFVVWSLKPNKNAQF